MLDHQLLWKYWKILEDSLKSCIGELVFQILFSLPFYFSLSNFPHHLISQQFSLHLPLFPLFLSLLLDYYMSLSFHSPSCLITFFLYSSLQQPYKFIVADVAMRENGFWVSSNPTNPCCFSPKWLYRKESGCKPHISTLFWRFSAVRDYFPYFAFLFSIAPKLLCVILSFYLLLFSL